MEFVTINLSESQLRQMLTQAAQLGAHQAMRNAGLPVKDLYTRAELKKRHGAGLINRLLKKKKLTPHQLQDDDNHRIVYSETELLSQFI